MVDRGKRRNVGKALVLTIWTAASFFTAQYITLGIFWLLTNVIKVDLSFSNEAILNTIAAIITYVIALTIVIGAPWLAKKYHTTKEEIGLQRLPMWSELCLAPAGLIVYFIMSGLVMYIVMQLVPGFDITERQDVGFNLLVSQYEYILAFVTLVVIAPLAEEMLFRGYLYGMIKTCLPGWMSVIVVSVLFGAAHGQWNVAIDTFVLSIFLCIMRDLTGSLWPSIILHMLKNGIAYYFLFINPTIIRSLQ